MDFLEVAEYWIWINLGLYLLVFLAALILNFNFNTIMVGTIYLVPLIPWGLMTANLQRFLMVSVHNTVFGIIELVIFVITVKPADLTFDREHWKQLFGHVFPIALALIGLSLFSRMSAQPMSALEAGIIAGVFLAGALMRVAAVYQLGARAFKFDIVFREQQRLKTNQLYGLMRHPSYTAMMIVILAYALNTHDWIVGALGMLSAWFGFQYRIVSEELALQEQFGDEYQAYRQRTGMWMPGLPGFNKSD